MLFVWLEMTFNVRKKIGEKILEISGYLEIRKKNIYAILYCFMIAFLFLLLCSRSSFLYPYNNWDDANSYFSMGKALFNGRVIYRDVLDQKGPFLYFVYGLAYLISHTTFRGVFLMELILATVFLYYAKKSIELYVTSGIVYAVLPVLAAVVYSSVSFYWGGSAEEIELPFFGIGLYLLLKHYKEKETFFQKKDIFISGLCAGVILLIKFNSLGFFAAWMLAVVVGRVLKGQWKEMISDCLVFLGGMLLPSIPWVLYFAINKSLFYWYRGYIFYNVFVYSDLSDQAMTLGVRIYNLAKLLYWQIIVNIRYFIFIILGVLSLFASKKRTIGEKLAVLGLCIFTFLGIYIGGVDLMYYSLPLSVFTILGMIPVGQALERILLHKFWKKIVVVVSVALLLGSLFFANAYSMNTEYRKTTKEESYLYQLSQAIPEAEDNTLLNIGCFDAGLYTVTGIVPNCYWFQTQTILYDQVRSEQQSYIENHQVKYVLSRGENPEYIENAGYELICQVPAKLNQELDTMFYLYKLKNP